MADVPSDLTSVVEQARLAEAPGHAVIATDYEDVIVYWGRGAEELYGWRESEVLGRRIVEVTPTALSREQAEAILRTLRNGDPWSGEFLVRGREGNRFAVSVTDMPVRDADGRLLGVIGISRRIGYLHNAD